jgi:hypothetical protein
VENFLIVQPVELRARRDRETPHEYGAVTALHRQAARRHGRVAKRAPIIRLGGPKEILRRAERKGGKPTRAREAASYRKRIPKMKDPSGGTTGRVKPYGALGVDGRSRRIQPMGRDYRSHINKSQHPHRTFKTPADFFDLVLGAIAAKTTAQQAISRRLRPICPTPSTAGSRSVPGSRKRYRQTDRGPAFFLRQACRKPRQAAPPARRSTR